MSTGSLGKKAPEFDGRSTPFNSLLYLAAALLLILLFGGLFLYNRKKNF